MMNSRRIRFNLCVIFVGALAIVAPYGWSTSLPQEGLEFTVKCKSGKIAYRKIQSVKSNENVAEFVELNEGKAPYSPVMVLRIKDGDNVITASMAPFQQCSGSFFRISSPRGIQSAITNASMEDWGKLIKMDPFENVEAQYINLHSDGNRKYNIKLKFESVPDKASQIKIFEKGKEVGGRGQEYSYECLFDKEKGIPVSMVYENKEAPDSCDFVVESPPPPQSVPPIPPSSRKEKPSRP